MGQHLLNNSSTSLYFTEKSYSPYDVYKFSLTLESYRSRVLMKTCIFRKLNIIKLDDLISYHIAVFMYRFNNSLIPCAFDASFL